MQDCFIIRKKGIDISNSDISESLKGTVQIEGEMIPIDSIEGEMIEVPFDAPDPLLQTIPLEDINHDGTILIMNNTTETPITLYYKQNIVEPSYSELVIPGKGNTFSITIGGITYTKDSSNNDLTENGTKVFFLKRRQDSQAYYFYKTDLVNADFYEYKNEDFLRQKADDNLYHFYYLGRDTLKTNNGKAICFLVKVLSGNYSIDHIILIGKNQADVEAKSVLNGTTYSWQSNQKFSWSWEQNEKTYYMNIYTYNSAYGRDTSYVPFLGQQKLIILDTNVHCLSNGFNFEIVNEFGYLLEEE